MYLLQIGTVDAGTGQGRPHGPTRGLVTRMRRASPSHAA